MASRFMHIAADGGVVVKHRGVVGRVIPVKATDGAVLRWDGYVGQAKVTSSRTQRNCAWNICKHLGIQEQSLQGPPQPTRSRNRY